MTKNGGGVFPFTIKIENIENLKLRREPIHFGYQAYSFNRKKYYYKNIASNELHGQSSLYCLNLLNLRMVALS